jgi:acyl carrier protein
VPPRDELETQLVAIWENVLRLQPIGITDNFFELGGDSLAAVQIFVEIEQTLGKRLPLAAGQRATLVSDRPYRIAHDSGSDCHQGSLNDKREILFNRPGDQAADVISL